MAAEGRGYASQWSRRLEEGREGEKERGRKGGRVRGREERRGRREGEVGREGNTHWRSLVARHILPSGKFYVRLGTKVHFIFPRKAIDMRPLSLISHF